MSTVNIDKMRRANQRAIEIHEQAERRAWLASLTPTHRAIHEGPWVPFCSECLNASMRRAGEVFARAMAPRTPR